MPVCSRAGRQSATADPFQLLRLQLLHGEPLACARYLRPGPPLEGLAKPSAEPAHACYTAVASLCVPMPAQRLESAWLGAAPAPTDARAAATQTSPSAPLVGTGTQPTSRKTDPFRRPHAQASALCPVPSACCLRTGSGMLHLHVRRAGWRQLWQPLPEDKTTLTMTATFS